MLFSRAPDGLQSSLGLLFSTFVFFLLSFFFLCMPFGGFLSFRLGWFWARCIKLECQGEFLMGDSLAGDPVLLRWMHEDGMDAVVGS